jgi:predicted glycoside hydrolase/deacetylase ChbG (UPF0249 family)
MTRSVALCADDFGLGPGICAGIVELAQRGRLSAVSCLVGAPAWREQAPRLGDMPASVQRGLHFSLTQGEPASTALQRVWPRLPSLPSLLLEAALGRLPVAAIAQEWRAQWDAFLAAVGRAPDFVDGHQHVHHLPGVRQVVLDAAAAAGIAVRNTGRVAGPGFAFKRLVIERSGGRALERLLRARGIAHNTVLAGVYDFAPRDYRELVRGWLAGAPAEGALLMCHPAADGPALPGDAIAAARVREAHYLGSAQFVDDLAAAGVTVGRAWLQRPSVH